MNKYIYENYIGDEAFLFIKCADVDKTCVIPFANFLAEHGVKIFADIPGSNDSVSPQRLAMIIKRADTAIFFITEKACENLEFRNSINYAAGIKKRIVCIMGKHSKPAQGLEMQLANAEKLTFEGNEMNLEDMLVRLKDSKIVTQATLGGNPNIKPAGSKKRGFMALAIILAVAAFSYLAWNVAVDRVRYYKSAEWLLRDSDGKDYVSLQGAGEDGIRALKGMTIKELDLRKGDITDMAGIEDVNVMLIDLGDCSNIDNMDAITRSDGLIRVRIPQDMVKYIEGIPENDIEFELTERVGEDEEFNRVEESMN